MLMAICKHMAVDSKSDLSVITVNALSMVAHRNNWQQQAAIAMAVRAFVIAPSLLSAVAMTNVFTGIYDNNTDNKTKTIPPAMATVAVVLSASGTAVSIEMTRMLIEIFTNAPVTGRLLSTIK